MLILRPDFYLLYWQVRAPAWWRPPGLTWEPGSSRCWGPTLTWVAFLKPRKASKVSCHFQNALAFQKLKPHWLIVKLKLLNALIACANETQPPKTLISLRFSFTATASPLTLTLWFHVEALSLVLLNMPTVHQGSEDGDLAANSGHWIVQCPVDVVLHESWQYLHGYRLPEHWAMPGVHSLGLTLLSWVSVLPSIVPADVPEETLFKNSRLRQPLTLQLVRHRLYGSFAWT